MNDTQPADAHTDTQRPGTETRTETETAAAPPRRRTRALLLGAAGAALLLLVGGGAFAIGANLADDDRSQPVSSSSPAPATTPPPSESDRRSGSDAGASVRADQRPATDAAALRSAAERAIAAVNGTGATSIDVERGGYEVEVRLPDGSETEVFVATDGAVTQRAERDADDRRDPLLDLDRLGDIVDAALAASASAGGVEAAIDSVSTTEDRGVAYEVSILLADGRDIDVELAADLSVVAVDLED